MTEANWSNPSKTFDRTIKLFKFPPNKLEEGYQFLTTADRLIGHNIIGFDIPMVHKFSDVDLSDKEVIDTLVLSRLFNPTRDGGHALESWGYKLGYPKIEFSDYQNYSTERLPDEKNSCSKF